MIYFSADDSRLGQILWRFRKEPSVTARAIFPAGWSGCPSCQPTNSVEALKA